MRDKAKFWLALLGAVVTALVQTLPEGDVRSWLTIAMPVITAVLVFLQPNVEGVNALRRKLAAAEEARRP